MNKLFVSTIILVFFLWLIPLAAFVKPSQDVLICNGQRAICLCRQADAASSKAKPTNMTIFQSGLNETPKVSSGFAPNDFLVRTHPRLGFAEVVVHRFEYLRAYLFTYCPSIDQVPKNA